MARSRSSASLIPFDSLRRVAGGASPSQATAPHPAPAAPPQATAAPENAGPWLCAKCGEWVRVKSNVAAHEASHGHQ